MRAGEYMTAASEAGFQVDPIVPGRMAAMAYLDEVRPYLATPFRYSSDLSLLNFTLLATVAPAGM
jgi:hypothetical protein